MPAPRWLWKLSRCPWLALLVLLAPWPTRAAEEADEPMRNTLRPHARALEFEVEPRLGGLAGSATISGKYHLSARTAIRVGLLFAASGGGGSSEDRLYQDTLLITSSSSGDSDAHTINVFAHAVRYAHLGARFGLFGFAGPTVRQEWSSQSSTSHDSRSPAISASHSEGRTWGVGSDLGAGLEWFFSRRFSLGARWGMAFMYSEPHSMSRQESSDGVNPSEVRIHESSGHGFTINSTPAVIMLSGYF